MSYPPAPWSLRGHALCRLCLLDIARAKAFVPPEVSIVSLLPGRTLGGLYLAAYQAGSVLEYHELIVIPALVRYRYRLGAWISHIYVDDPRSVAGGREIWGLPKQLAEFSWDKPSGPAVIRQDGQLLCMLRPGRRRSLGRLPILLPALSRKSDILWFRGTGAARLGLTQTELDVSRTSPFHALGFDQGYSLQLHDLEMTVHAPSCLTSA